MGAVLIEELQVFARFGAFVESYQETVHEFARQMLDSVMKAPLSFFETTPTGRYGDLSICLMIHVDRGPKDLELVLSRHLRRRSGSWESEYIARQRH